MYLTVCGREFAVATLQAIQSQIEQDATLPVGTAVDGQNRTVTRALVMADRGAEAAASETVTVGEGPEGFGQGFVWGREDNQALLAVYLSAADVLGVSIEGLQAGDRIVVTAATGLASFAEDDGSLERGLIGLIASGASVGAGIAGHPEALPFIKAAEEFAKDQFRPEDIRTKVRDPYGVDPANGLFARQEGGVLVCLPEAGGTYYSGDSESRWIQASGGGSFWDFEANPGQGVRVPENYPDHVRRAFFLRREEVMALTPHTTRVDGGQAFLITWDFDFADNAGYYKLYVRLEKGQLDLGDVERWTRRFEDLRRLFS